MSRALVGLVVMAACTENSPPPKGRTTNTSSRTIASPKGRAEFLCSYELCPTKPIDAAFHVYYQDNSTGLLPAPSDSTTYAVVKIAPDDAALWARGCESTAVDVRPDWAKELLAERPEWAPKSAPDTYRCPFGQERVIHVKEGVVIWQVVRN